MRHRIIWAILALILTVPSITLGQQAVTTTTTTITKDTTVKPHVSTMRPFAKFPLTQETAVQALKRGSDGDTAVLYVKASVLVDTWNKAFDLRLENREALEEFIRSMDVSACPKNMQLSRVRKDGTVDLKGWNREAHLNELCLVKDGRVYASLSCFNTTPSLYLANWESPKVRQAKEFVAMLDRRAKEIADSLSKARQDSIRAEEEAQRQRAEWLVEYNRRLAAYTAANQGTSNAEPKEKSWLSQHWRWPVATAIIGTAVGVAGNHYGWWGGRNITQCTAINSPGFCSRR